MRYSFSSFLVALVCVVPVWGQSSGVAADLIIRNANIWTVDPSRPEAEAVVVLGDRIVAVGYQSRARRLAWHRDTHR